MKIFFVCGTWQSGLGLFRNIADGIEGIESVLIPSPAKYGDGMSYKQSVAATELNIFNQLADLDEPYSLVAYSQGAHASGNIVKDFPLKNLVRLYNIADPMRSPKDKLVGPLVGGSGIMGSREIGPRATQIVAPGDIVAANGNPFVRNVARYSVDMSLTNPIGWIKSFGAAARMHEEGGKPLDAFKEVTKYLATQVHIRYSDYEIEPGLTVPDYIIREINHDRALIK
jgi:hypothetical protein